MSVGYGSEESVNEFSAIALGLRPVGEPTPEILACDGDTEEPCDSMRFG